MNTAPKVRFKPVYKPGKEHAGHVDGYVVHPDDRQVRQPVIAKKRAVKR